MSQTAEDRILESFTSSLGRATCFDAPYRHWCIEQLFPQDIFAQLQSIEFPVGALDGLSGKRELHNDTRHYFDQENIARFPAIAAVAKVFQTPPAITEIEKFFGADLAGTYLRVEYAQDVTGFWLEPHTDIGVKRLTVLIYLSDGQGHESLGTDIYSSSKQWVKRSSFAPNYAMAFVPGDNTFHGFEKREINGVRKSLILNYVTTDWRDREQLAFPNETVRAI